MEQHTQKDEDEAKRECQFYENVLRSGKYLLSGRLIKLIFFFITSVLQFIFFFSLLFLSLLTIDCRC